MKFTAEIDVMPLDALLDPQGKAVTQALSNLGMQTVSNVRIGKHMTLTIEASNESEAHEITDQACKQLLCNPIMEQYRFVIKSN
jgi:phosphoribosylformylglycinamidine synthase